MYFCLAVRVVGSRHTEEAGKMSKRTQNYYPDTGHHTRESYKMIYVYF